MPARGNPLDCLLKAPNDGDRLRLIFGFLVWLLLGILRLRWLLRRLLFTPRAGISTRTWFYLNDWIGFVGSCGVRRDRVLCRRWLRFG